MTAEDNKGMISAYLMLQRFIKAIQASARDRGFLTVLGAGFFLILTGTISYSLNDGWSLIGGFYFAVATLTTSSIADPRLTLDNPFMKIFTVFYILIGIGILVEIARQIGIGFIKVRTEKQATKTSKKKKR